MEVDEALHQRFLEKLRALEAFRISYSGAHPGLPLERADQDIQRLLEAQAFFSARTARVAEANMTRGTRRLFSQHLPYLLAPSPAMGFVQAELDPQFVDPVVLPPGEPLSLTPISDELLQDTPPPVALVTTSALRLLPIRMTTCRFERRRPEGQAELHLGFSASHRRRWPPGPLALHVDHLGDLDASASVYHAMEGSALSAELQWDGSAPVGCPIQFGPPKGVRPGRQGFLHPLEGVRGFFQLPEQDLLVTLLPPKPPGEWTRFEVRVRFSEDWPRGLEPSADALKLHVAPVANLARELASPITIDGTSAEQPIIHPDPYAGFVPHSVASALRADSTAGLVPMRPGFIPSPSGGEPRWEADLFGFGQKRKANLRVVVPQALIDPFRVSVDARWHQPARVAQAESDAEVEVALRSIPGLSFKLRSRLRPAVDGYLEGDDDALLALLGARSRRTLGLSQLRTLIEVLRGPAEKNFGDVAEALDALEVKTVPSAMSASGFRYRYRVTAQAEDPRTLPRWRLFFARLREVLEVWSTEDVVELEVWLPRLQVSLLYDGQERSR